MITSSPTLNHASIIDGCRLSRAKIHVFPHKDTAKAAQILEDLDGAVPQILITDGVFSMDGDIGPLPALVELAEQHGAIMISTMPILRAFLPYGRGTVDHFGLHGRVDVQVGTLSKAIGVLGGYVLEFCITGRGRFCSPRHIRQRLRRLAWRPSTFWSASRSASRSCGKHPLLQGIARQPDSTMATATPLHQSSWAKPTAHTFSAACSTTDC